MQWLPLFFRDWVARQRASHPKRSKAATISSLLQRRTD